MVPAWANGAVIYQIFPDRFCNGDRENDVRSGEYFYEPGGWADFCEDWNTLPLPRDVHRFYGGDLEGIWDKLDYLKGLGVEVILLNPIFKSPSNHKYDTTDYYQIDPHLTSKHARNQADIAQELSPNEYFAHFVRAVHDKGMRLILDGVFNHCGGECKWTCDESRRDYFYYSEDGERECWWDMSTLPKLNYDTCDALWDEIINIGKMWVSEPYNCDGWRLDVAADLSHSEDINHKFWKRFSDEVKSSRPDAFIFAEHYGSPKAWLDNGEWDSIMNYDGFMEPVSWFFTGVDKHCDNEDKTKLGDCEYFANALEGGLANLSVASPALDENSSVATEASTKTAISPSALSAINQLDNHDHSRFITRTKGWVGRLDSLGGESAGEGVSIDALRLAVIFQMTWPGAPTLYYGDETAIPGWTDPDNRRTYPWGREDYHLLDFYKQAIILHKSSEAFRTGGVEIVYKEDGVFGFVRGDECETQPSEKPIRLLEGASAGSENTERFLVLINRSEEERCIKIPTIGTDFTRVFETSPSLIEGYNVGHKKLACRDESGDFFDGGEKVEIHDGDISVKLAGLSSIVIKIN